jgi:hypothetical protein
MAQIALKGANTLGKLGSKLVSKIGSIGKNASTAKVANAVENAVGKPATGTVANTVENAVRNTSNEPILQDTVQTLVNEPIVASQITNSLTSPSPANETPAAISTPVMAVNRSNGPGPGPRDPNGQKNANQTPDNIPSDQELTESFNTQFRRSDIPDQRGELNDAVVDTLNNLKKILAENETKHCLVNGFAELIEETSSDFIYYMNEAMLEIAVKDPNIRLMVKSLIEDMIAEIINTISPEEKEMILKNLNGECRMAFQTFTG